MKQILTILSEIDYSKISLDRLIIEPKKGGNSVTIVFNGGYYIEGFLGQLEMEMYLTNDLLIERLQKEIDSEIEKLKSQGKLSSFEESRI